MPTKTKLQDLKLYKDDQIRGYDSTDIYDFMKEHGLLKQWQKWSMGSTGAIIDGHLIVYEWDVTRFLEGKENDD